MLEELQSLLAARRGHFRYESGHHGDTWLELERLYVRPTQLQPFVTALASWFANQSIEAVCGPWVGGSFLALLIAHELDIDFIVAEPFQVASSNHLYPIAYRIPDPLGRVVLDKRVAVVDDVINAGSAARGAIRALRDVGALPVALGALMILGTAAYELAKREGVLLASLGRIDHVLWTPHDCPLCASGVPLEGIPEP